MSKNVVVLGATGMLGSMVCRVLSQDPNLDVLATARYRTLVPTPTINLEIFDAAVASADDIAALIHGSDWVVNCIGITKPMIDERNAGSVERARAINCSLPARLADAAERIGARVLQIATDCVYSGTEGDYRESSPHDAIDVYGQTKSTGEVVSPAMHHLRTSIIGPEERNHRFLLDWFIRQPRAAAVKGFTNHRWNGVTTMHFARVAGGIILGDTPLPAIQHLVPRDAMTKFEMLQCFAQHYEREDIVIEPCAAETAVDRTLATENTKLNAALWQDGGYSYVPTISHMIAELANVREGCRV